MLRNILVLILVTFSVSISFADTEFEGSVPLELVKALLGNTPFGEPTIYSDLSSAFPEINVPDELEIMGSIERGYGIAAVYSTELTGSQTESVLRESFLQAGYIEFDLPTRRSSEFGFVSTSMSVPQRYNRFCHDSLGSFSFPYMAQDPAGTVTI